MPSVELNYTTEKIDQFNENEKNIFTQKSVKGEFIIHPVK